MLSNKSIFGIDAGIKRTINIMEIIEQITPVAFNEKHRYLPPAVTRHPGKMSFDSFPYWREVLDCFDVNCPIREVNLMKGVQVGYTTVLESILLYFMFHVRTAPCMMITADKDLIKGRIENSIIPMIQQSGFSDRIRSSDIGSSLKRGITQAHIQWSGGYLIPAGANNADKMRMWSILLMLKDEIDAWPEYIGQDGCPDALTDDRCSGFTDVRKIFRGSTPLLEINSKINRNFLKGDQRYYYVNCIGCGFPQYLEFSKRDDNKTKIGGIFWETDNNQLIHESVCYRCPECKHDHFEHDKNKLFDPASGAKWTPTATPTDPFIRSYHLSAMYSPDGFKPWSACVTAFLDAYDVGANKVKDLGLYQRFVNNILGKSFEEFGSKVSFEAVSLHRRMCYDMGQVPNDFASKNCGSKISMLTCTVDVQKRFLAVAVIGWTRGMRNFVIHYEHIQGKDFESPDEPGWQTLSDLILNNTYSDGAGREYPICGTFIDCNYAMATVLSFCQEFDGSVYPILGRDRPEKAQSIKEFTEFTTAQQTRGYKITTDHYKDRIGPNLKREWREGDGLQPAYHFNAPSDIGDDFLKELTREQRKRKLDKVGRAIYFWDRDHSNARNELWDLLVYAHCLVEVMAHNMCVKTFELEDVNWDQFWTYIENERVYFEQS